MNARVCPGSMLLTAEIQRLVREEGLGYGATVRPDGSPPLSPKGTLSVVDEQHLAFVNLASPHTVAKGGCGGWRNLTSRGSDCV
jgi:hypothetical protein